MVKGWMAAAMAIVVATAGSALAQPTDITVRVMSKDAKFIGTSMGGVRVTITDVDTGELLAQGVTEGATGDTRLLMTAEKPRRQPVSTPNAAKFTATIDIDEPRLVKVAVTGPLAQRQALATATATQWVVPGKHITGGDGWVIELPGFAIDILSPPTHVALRGVPQEVEITAHVVMMCGCPIEPDGLWDANQYEVTALLKRDGEPVGELPLSYAGKTSHFAATWTVDEPGVYEATVYAYDAANGNTGVDKVTFLVGN